ncbi:hypothetical protein [Amycolatopsis saalfeldensis]|nr:hypothetical protein [Amycolatopsis saalfeldensis]
MIGLASVLALPLVVGAQPAQGIGLLPAGLGAVGVRFFWLSAGSSPRWR